MIEKNPQLSNGCGQKTIKKEVFVMVENYVHEACPLGKLLYPSS
jgi:hypothetical protein